MPIVIPFCPDDSVPQPGRINAAWVPEFVVENFFGRGADFSPITPLQTTGTFTDPGPLVLTLATTATEDQRVSGIIIDIMSNNNTSPGITTIEFVGTFENNAAWTQTVQFSTGHIGLSRFVLMPTREVQGGAYPALLRVNPVTLQIGDVVGAGTDVVAEVHTIVGTVTGSVPGTSVRLETLSPVSELWYQAMAAWYLTAEPYAPRRTGG
jgi:hypothetical protein